MARLQQRYELNHALLVRRAVAQHVAAQAEGELDCALE